MGKHKKNWCNIGVGNTYIKCPVDVCVPGSHYTDLNDMYSSDKPIKGCKQCGSIRYEYLEGGKDCKCRKCGFKWKKRSTNESRAGEGEKTSE